MQKDAFYFPHFSNARHDRKLRRVRKELGVEGYGIYFMILETLRDQDKYIFPMGDIDLLADEFGTSEQKIRTVVCNYGLFQTDDNEMFTSPKFIEFLKPYVEGKERKRVNGLRGNLIRYKHITKDQSEKMNDAEIVSLSADIKSRVAMVSLSEQSSDRKSSQSKEKKVKESKTNEKKANILIPEGLSELLSSKLKEFIKYRKEIKKPLKTNRPITAMVSNIGSEFVNEDHLIQCIDHVMDNEWQKPKGEYVKYSQSMATEEIDYTKGIF